MKIINGKPKFQILTSKSELKNQLIRIEKAGRTCYQSEKGKVSVNSAKKFTAMIIKRGHESVIEHSSLTVKFFNLSRGFTHEIVRHRLASFSQESTRYVDYAKRGEEVDLDKFQLHCIAPPHRNEKEKVELENGEKLSLKDMFANIEKYYRGLRKAGWLPEDARQVLPIGIKSEIVVTANLREWRHIFELRTSQFAHWEIRIAMIALLKELKKILPGIFDDFQKVGVDKNSIEYYQKK